MLRDNIRSETRQERYDIKQKQAQTFPVEITCSNLDFDSNVAFLARSAACFGAQKLNVIGRMPEYKDLKRLSAGQSSLIDIQNYSNPTEFIRYCKENNRFLVSAELTDNAQNLYDIDFPKDRVTVFVVGHETYGVPAEIMHRSDLIVKIPLHGPGFCLNTATCGSILLSHYVEKYLKGMPC